MFPQTRTRDESDRRREDPPFGRRGWNAVARAVVREPVTDQVSDAVLPEDLCRSVRVLPPWKQIAFMALVAARMLPNYARFSADTGFGDASALRRAADAAWIFVRSGEPPEDLADLKDDCESQAPDLEQFQSSRAPPALDAVNAAAVILEAIGDPERARPAAVVTLACETVSLVVQQQLALDPDAPNFGAAILRHDLMQQELRRQREDLETLARWPGHRQAWADALCVRSS